jgi:hypothetical protein
LGEDVAEFGVVALFVDVMDPYMSTIAFSISLHSKCGSCAERLPLQIIGSRILVFSVWTEWTHIARRLMHEAVAYHFVFAFEAFSAFGTGTASDWAVVRPVLRVDVCVRTMPLISNFCLGHCLVSFELSKNLLQQILRLKRKCIATRIITPKRSHTMLSQLLHARPVWRR